MRTLLFGAAVAFICAASYADNATPSADTNTASTVATEKRKLTPEERKARIQLSMMKRNGGIVRDKRDMAGSFKVINAQDKIGNDKLAGYLSDVEDSALFELKLESAQPKSVTLATIDKALEASKADVAVFIIEDDMLPGLLVAPENRWAVINIKPYAGEFQTLRVGRELARAVAYVGGAACDGFGMSLMGAITEPQQLDNFKSSRLNFETAGKMAIYLKELGVRPFSKITYRETCRLGFAAQPTNEYQQAIWNEYHELPSKPVKIEYDPKKGR